MVRAKSGELIPAGISRNQSEDKKAKTKKKENLKDDPGSNGLDLNMLMAMI